MQQQNEDGGALTWCWRVGFWASWRWVYPLHLPSGAAATESKRASPFRHTNHIELIGTIQIAMADTATVALNLPSKYASAAKAKGSVEVPTIEWLSRTWTVTHSTLSMWRSARNVRITYKHLEPKADGRARIDDLVEYESNSKPKSTALKSVAGVDTQSPAGGWDWRGKGWLCFVTSHWELLGWGEATTPEGKTERWAVTWFAPTVFTKEGVDVYCDAKEGLSNQTYARIEEALKQMDAEDVVTMVHNDMQPVEIQLPWREQ